jgi:methyl-accepting chemotaxis protein
MSSMIASTNGYVKSSLETAEAAQTRSTEGRAIMQDMSQSMTSIQNANTQLQDFAKIIENIQSKTHVINDIVMKTQLLSFNASIEAARAGQYGRGFAVVAEEVGTLAKTSGNAAREIDHLLADSQHRVKEILNAVQGSVGDGQMVSERALAAFSEISQQVGEIYIQVKSINEASSQQELGIQSVSTAMREMDSSAQSNKSSSDQAYHNSEQLRVESEELRKVSESLEMLVIGRVGSLNKEPKEKQAKVETKPKATPRHTTDDLESVAQALLQDRGPQSGVSPHPASGFDDTDFKRADSSDWTRHAG